MRKRIIAVALGSALTVTLLVSCAPQDAPSPAVTVAPESVATAAFEGWDGNEGSEAKASTDESEGIGRRAARDESEFSPEEIQDVEEYEKYVKEHPPVFLSKTPDELRENGEMYEEHDLFHCEPVEIPSFYSERPLGKGETSDLTFYTFKDSSGKEHLRAWGYRIDTQTREIYDAGFYKVTTSELPDALNSASIYIQGELLDEDAKPVDILDDAVLAGVVA